MDEPDQLQQSLDDLYKRGFRAGREQGMREAAALADPLTKGYYDHARAPYIIYRDAILAAIEGKK